MEACAQGVSGLHTCLHTHTTHAHTHYPHAAPATLGRYTTRCCLPHMRPKAPGRSFGPCHHAGNCTVHPFVLRLLLAPSLPHSPPRSPNPAPPSPPRSAAPRVVWFTRTLMFLIAATMLFPVPSYFEQNSSLMDLLLDEEVSVRAPPGTTPHGVCLEGLGPKRGLSFSSAPSFTSAFSRTPPYSPLRSRPSSLYSRPSPLTPHSSRRARRTLRRISGTCIRWRSGGTGWRGPW